MRALHGNGRGPQEGRGKRARVNPSAGGKEAEHGTAANHFGGTLQMRAHFDHLSEEFDRVVGGGQSGAP
eukprot:14935602-Alexandrium_andersonii.AAC.1